MGARIDRCLENRDSFVKMLEARPNFEMFVEPGFCNVCYFYKPQENMTKEDVHILTAQIKQRMMTRGGVLVNYQPRQDHPNFWRMVFTNPNADDSDLAFVLDETEAIAAAQTGNGGVYMVPALTGLGAPHWAPNARGAIYGITRDTGPADFVRAALESVAYQTNDLFTAIASDGISVSVVRVDGGMTANDWLMQFVADIIDLQVDRPVVRETTALGAAMLALMQSDSSITLDGLASRWQREASFTPAMDASDRNSLVAGWKLAIERTLTEG